MAAWCALSASMRRSATMTVGRHAVVLGRQAVRPILVRSSSGELCLAITSSRLQHLILSEYCHANTTCAHCLICLLGFHQGDEQGQQRFLERVLWPLLLSMQLVWLNPCASTSTSLEVS